MNAFVAIVEQRSFAKAAVQLGYPLLGGLEHKVCCGSQHTRSSMPVVLMSGYPGGAAGEAALAIGADEALQKPLSARDLATSLARV
jgi:DNA-binding response OmpR family regulator